MLNIIAFFIGLIITWLISFLEISISNHHLADTLTLLTQSGHTVVPIGQAFSSLSNPISSLFGALFFVATAGSLITATSFLYYKFISLIFQLFHFSQFKRCTYILPFLITSLFMASTGESVSTIGYTLLIPLGVLYVFEKNTYHCLLANNRPTRVTIIMLLVFILLVSLFYYRSDASIFLRARDNLLLTNQAGIALNDFYYKYTLFASRVIAPPINKQIKSCWVDPQLPHSKTIKKILSRYGWLTIQNSNNASLILKKSHFTTPKCKSAMLTESAPHSGSPHVDLVLNKSKKLQIPIKSLPIIKMREDCIFEISSTTNEMTSIPLINFFQTPYDFLLEISSMGDSHIFLRKMCFWGLSIALPFVSFLFLFLSISSFINQLIIFFLKHCSRQLQRIKCVKSSDWSKSSATIRISCLTTTSILLLIFSNLLLNKLYPLHPGMRMSFSFHLNSNADEFNLDQMLNNPSSSIRVEALRMMYKRKNLSINTLNLHRSHTFIEKMNTTAEKYWLANILGKKGGKETIPHLKKLVEDPAINVQCSSARALSLIGQRIISTHRNKDMVHSSKVVQSSNSYESDKKIVFEIISFLEKRLLNTPDWYVQRSLYQAIQTLRLKADRIYDE